MISSESSEKSSNGSEVRIVRAEFERPADSVHLLPPPTIPEVAFVGRSNVGKSSLLNALCNKRKLARTSKTPGRTQALNFFRIEFDALSESADPEGEAYRFECYFVDLPGFGYAKVSKDMKNRWRALIGKYLFERRSLEAIVLLIDSRREPGSEELWLADQGRKGKLWIALTKCDKLSKVELREARAQRAKDLKLPPERIVPISVLRKEAGDVNVLRQKLLGGLTKRR